MSDTINVLHVEDDPGFGELVRDFLERKDDRLTVTSVPSAEDALTWLEEDRPDCIVSDYDMAERNGIELLEAVRGDHPELPFILFTGKGSEEVASEAISAGATDYLQKGAGTEQYDILANRICNAVERHRSSLRAENLDRLRRLTAEINEALVQAATQEEIESEVCRIFSQAEPYVFAWIGDVDPESDRVDPRVTAGDGAGYLDEISVPAGTDSTPEGPAAIAVQERAVATTQDVKTDPAFERWRDAALERGFRSVAAVPLQYDDRLYGILVVYARQEQLFDEAEQSLIAELADDVAHAMHARKVREQFELREKAISEAPVGVTITDPTQEGNPIVYANDRFEEISGYSAAQARGRSCRFLQGPETREERSEKLLNAIENRESVTVELRNYRRDGELFWNRMSIAPVHDEDGTATHFVVFQEDVTDRKERERELRLYEDLAESVPVPIFRTRIDGEILGFNEAFRKQFGADSTQDISERNAEELWVDVEERYELIEEARRNQTVQQRLSRMQTLDGEQLWIEVTMTITNGGDEPYLVGICHDVSEREFRKRKLRRNERRFEALFEDPNTWVCLLDRDGVIRSVNDTARQHVVESGSDLVGTPFWEVSWWNPDQSDELRGWIDRAASGESVRFEATYSTTNGDVPVDGTVRPVVDDSGDVVSIVVTARESTE